MVQKGDTLWDLSSRYYRNAWAWPKLWSYNPQITNPHWIYPGDVLRILPPGGRGTPSPQPDREALPTSRIIGRRQRPSGIFLRQTGFVEPGELAQAGKIIGSKEEKLMLGTLDEAYVAVQHRIARSRSASATPIYGWRGAVKHPVTGKYLGHIVEILGEGEVRAVTDANIARIAHRRLDRPDRARLPRRAAQARVQAGAADRRQDRTCRRSSSPRCARTSCVGADDLVFIDRGKSDGVELGNRFLVTRRGDGYQPLLSTGPMDDRRFPRETIGEIWSSICATTRHRLHHLLDGGVARRRSRRGASRLLSLSL